MNAVRWTPKRAGAVVLATALAAACSNPRPAAGQDLARSVVAGGDGTVRLAVPTREGVEICDQGIRMGEHRIWWRSHGRYEMDSNCHPGPLEIELDVRDGFVRRLETLRATGDRTAGARDLGEVDPAEAVRYLSSLVRGSASERAARDAVFPMVLADVPDVWRELMALARERDVPSGARKNAIFWLGQEAASAATQGLADVAGDEDEEQEVRDAAVFALSQRPHEEGVPALMELARNAREAKTRKSAMFWLAQSDDPRVLAFFEEILLGRGGG